MGCNAIFTICTVCTIAPVFSIRTVCTVLALGLNLVAVLVSQPVAIECPIVDTIRILLYTDSGCYAIFTICSIFTVLSVFPVIDSNGITFAKRNSVADLFPALHNGCDACNIVVILQCGYDGLQR